MTTQHLSAEEITIYLDGECTDAEQRQAADHLAICADCRQLADDEQFIKSLLGSMAEPELPRSFVLPSEMATAPGSLSSPADPQPIAASATNITRFEPMMRFLSIAAVLAFLVLGGAQLAGVGESDSTNPNGQIERTETNGEDSALEEQETTIARGEVRAQGESAAAGAGPFSAEHTLGETPAQATENGLTPIEYTTIGVGAVALVSIAGWILIRYRAGETSHQM